MNSIISVTSYNIETSDLALYIKKEEIFKVKILRLKYLIEEKESLRYVLHYAVDKPKVSLALSSSAAEYSSLIIDLNLNPDYPDFESTIKNFKSSDDDEGESYYAVCCMIK